MATTTETKVYDPAMKPGGPNGSAPAPAGPTALAKGPRGGGEIVRLSMDTVQGFEALQRAARLLCASSLVPERYRGPEGLPNAVIALEMATRIGASPLMAMQHLYVVHGTPGWSAQFVIASVNSCGRFSALRYEWKGKPGSPEWGCRAWAIEKETNTRLDGSWVTLQQVKDQGWWFKPAKGDPDKNASKWPLMTEQMFMYRAAAYWQRAYAPEVGMGLRTTEEIEDTVIDVTSIEIPAAPRNEPDARDAPAADEVAAAPAEPEPPKKGAAAVKAAIAKNAPQATSEPAPPAQASGAATAAEATPPASDAAAPPQEGERKAPEVSASCQARFRGGGTPASDEFNFDR